MSNVAQIVSRALSLVGKPRSEYKCNHVVNFALFGTKEGGLASSFLAWGQPADKPAAGVVVVGKDGKHVGIFINDHEFVHSSEQLGQVIRRGTDQLKYAFLAGYVLRKN